MAGLSVSGITSGLDVKSLVSQLMAVEQQPLVALNKKEATQQAKISAFGSLKSVLSTLKTAAESLIPGAGITALEKYTTTSASLSDATLATASATNAAAAGSYALTDIVLAKSQQIHKTGLAMPADAGTLEITVGTGTAVSVAIGANSTLANVRDAINASSAGINASIINNGTSDVLILTAKNSGEDNTITIQGSTTAGDGSAFDIFDYTSPGTNNGWTEQVAAGDASVKVNGIQVTSATNTISSSITGVTLNLVKEGAGPTTLTVSKSNSSITSSLNAFITAYNSAVTTMKSLGNYNAETKTASTLTGDSTLRMAQAQLRSTIFEANGGSNPDLQRLSDLGVSVQLDGTLKLDSSKLTKAIANDESGVAQLVSDVGTRFKTATSRLVDTEGVVSSKIDGINSTIKDIGKRRDALNLLLTKIEANYTRQFTALDVQLTKLQSISSSLTSQLASLPSASSS